MDGVKTKSRKYSGFLLICLSELNEVVIRVAAFIGFGFLLPFDLVFSGLGLFGFFWTWTLWFFLDLDSLVFLDLDSLVFSGSGLFGFFWIWTSLVFLDLDLIFQ